MTAPAGLRQAVGLWLCLAVQAGAGSSPAWGQAAVPSPAPAAGEGPARIAAQGTGEGEGAAAAEALAPVDVFEYVVRGNTVLDLRTIERTVTPYLGPGRTRQDIEAAREALGAAYQAAGYQSVVVELSDPVVSDGVVLLLVSEVRVGRLRVTGSEYTSLREVKDQVPSLREGEVPNFQQAQEELNALNRSGQRQVLPLVRQGALTGTMDVDLKVDDKSPWRGSIGLNNDRSADTRDLRLSLSAGHDNLWQLGHSASLSLFVTPQDVDQTQVISGSYTAPFKGSGWSVEASGYVSDSNVSTVGGTTVLGKGYAAGLKALYTVPEASDWWHTFSAGVEAKRNREALRMGTSGDHVPLDYAPVTLAYTCGRQGEASQLGLGLSAVIGTRSLLGYGSGWQQFDYKRYRAKPGFLVLKGDFNGSIEVFRGAQAGLRLAAQASDSPLVSGEQMAAGGMNSVRGYLSAERVGDVGLVGAVELRTRPVSLSAVALENARLYSFFDFGHLRLREPLPEQQSRFTLFSVGLGTSFAFGPHVNGRMDVGYPLRDGERTERKDARITFNLNASY